MSTHGDAHVDGARKLGFGCRALVVLLVVLTTLLVLVGIAAIPLLGLRSMFAAMKEEDDRIVEGSSRVIARFFEATTKGDVAAATSCLTPWGRERIDLAARIREDPESFSVARVSDFVALEIYHHHPFVIGAKLELTNGKVRYGRFRTDATQVGWVETAKGEKKLQDVTWVIDALRIGDAMPDKPRQDGHGGD